MRFSPRVGTVPAGNPAGTPSPHHAESRFGFGLGVNRQLDEADLATECA